MPERFSAATGVQIVTEQTIRTPYDAFKLFFDDELYRMIIESSKRKVQVTNLMLDAYFAA